LNHPVVGAGTAPAEVGPGRPPGLPVLGLVASLSEAPELSPGRWWHCVTGLDYKGRLTLPAEARQLADRASVVRVSSRGSAVVLRREGVGAVTPVDRRGRLLLPGWLRREAARDGGIVFVAARRPDASVVVVSPVDGLDAVAEGLAGEVG
jgi:DNA-binding transcriptional regulator/RsmH inhibitor MraZ